MGFWFQSASHAGLPIKFIKINPPALKQKITSLLVPGDPCRLGTHIYVVIVETSRLVEARPSGGGAWNSNVEVWQRLTLLKYL
jgi:hypothetical protein